MNSKKPSKLIKLSTTTPTTPTPPSHDSTSPPNHNIQGTKRRTATACGHALVEGLMGCSKEEKKPRYLTSTQIPKRKTEQKNPLANHTPKKLTNHPSGQQELLLLVKFQAIFVGWNETIRLEGPVTSVPFEKESGKDVATSMPGQICICKYLYIIRVLLASWWLNQPIWKIMLVKLDHFPR